MADFGTGQVTARPLRAGVFVAVSLVVLGIVGSALALSIILLTSALQQVDLGFAQTSRLATGMLSGFAGFGAAGLGCLALAMQSRASVDTDGWFRVRSWPPGRVREVDLGALAQVSSRTGPIRRPTFLLVARRSTVLRLMDRGGRIVEWNPAYWRESAMLASTLRQAAILTEATVDPAAAAVLDNPPFGNEP